MVCRHIYCCVTDITREIIFIFSLGELKGNCKQLAYTYVKYWMRWLKEAGGAGSSCVRDGGL